MNDPVSRFSLRAKVSDVLRDAVIADGFDIPAASILYRRSVVCGDRLRLAMAIIARLPVGYQLVRALCCCMIRYPSRDRAHLSAAVERVDTHSIRIASQ